MLSDLIWTAAEWPRLHTGASLHLFQKLRVRRIRVLAGLRELRAGTLRLAGGCVGVLHQEAVVHLEVFVALELLLEEETETAVFARGEFLDRILRRVHLQRAVPAIVQREQKLAPLEILAD